jgi:transcriptional regulator with AAA-type ATPase domain
VHPVLGVLGETHGGTLILRNLDALPEVDQRMLLSTLDLHVDAFRLIATLSEDPRHATAQVKLCEALFDLLVIGVLSG